MTKGSNILYHDLDGATCEGEIWLNGVRVYPIDLDIYYEPLGPPQVTMKLNAEVHRMEPPEKAKAAPVTIKLNVADKPDFQHQQELSNLRAELRKERGRIRTLQRQLDDQRRVVAEKRLQLDRMTLQLREKEQELAQLHKSKQELNDFRLRTIGIQDEEVGRLARERAQLKEEVEELTENRKFLEQRLSTAQGEARRAMSSEAVKHQAMMNAQRAASTLEKKVKNARELGKQIRNLLGPSDDTELDKVVDRLIAETV